MTIGRTIWFTGIWFSPEGYGDGSLGSLRKWLLHLAHEVGHLAQAERFGHSLLSRFRYVATFALQYTTRLLLFKRDPHDCSLEREADTGRAVLQELLADEGSSRQLLAAVQRNDVHAVLAWNKAREPLIAALSAGYGQDRQA